MLFLCMCKSDASVDLLENAFARLVDKWDAMPFFVIVS